MKTPNDQERKWNNIGYIESRLDMASQMIIDLKSDAKNFGSTALVIELDNIQYSLSQIRQDFLHGIAAGKYIQDIE